MNYKQLLNFYFNAEALNGAMDGLAMRFATSSADGVKGCGYYAEKICRVIEAKVAMGELWNFLDGVLSSVTQEDRRVLSLYSQRRGRVSRGEHAAGAISNEDEKALHRVLMKFSRRVSGRLHRFAEQVNVLKNYYCLINVRGR